MLNQHVQKLESFPSNGMGLLGQGISSGVISGLAFYGGPGYQYLSGGSVPQVQFTLLRPQPIFVVANTAYYSVGGTTVFSLQRCAILASPGTGTTGALDVNGVEMRGLEIYQYNIGSSAGMTNGSNSFCFTPPAGTYYASWGYFMNGGAATTLTIQTNSISVFVVGG